MKGKEKLCAKLSSAFLRKWCKYFPVVFFHLFRFETLICLPVAVDCCGAVGPSDNIVIEMSSNEFSSGWKYFQRSPKLHLRTDLHFFFSRGRAGRFRYLIWLFVCVDWRTCAQGRVRHDHMKNLLYFIEARRFYREKVGQIAIANAGRAR